MRNFWLAVRGFNRGVVLYLFYWSMIAFAYFGVQAVLLNIYLVRLGYGPEFIGMLLASGQLVWAVFALPAGFIGARFGVKRAIILGIMLLAAGIGLMLAAESLPKNMQAAGLVSAWMLSWVGAALGSVNGAPYLMAVTTEENRGFAFSAQQAVMSAAGFAGSLAAGLLPGFLASSLNVTLEHPAPYRAALLLAPVAYLAGAVIFSRAQPVTLAVQSAGAGEKRGAPLGLFLFFGLVVFLQAFGEGVVRPFFNIYLDLSLKVPVAQIGSVLGFSSLLLIFLSLVTPALLKRWGTAGILRLTSFGFSAFALLLAAVSQWPAVAFIFFGVSGMLTIMATARGIYNQELVQPQWRTTISAINTIGMALGWALASWVGGVLIERVGFGQMFIIGAIATFLSAGLLFLRKNISSIPTAGAEPDEQPVPAIAVTGKPEEGCF